jgi:RNA polymerase sigma-70 factor (ECF subfamily)
VNGLLSPARRASAAADAVLERELTTLVTAHYPRLIRIAGLICDRTADAEDAVQAGLEQAWRRRATLREIERLAPWLDRIVVREAIRLTSRNRSLLARFLPGPRSIDVDDDGQADPVAPMSDPASTAALRIAFARLPGPQRAVIVLHLYAGYSVAETAELIGAPDETVRSRLRLARARLRELLEEGHR